MGRNSKTGMLHTKLNACLGGYTALYGIKSTSVIDLAITKTGKIHSRKCVLHRTTEKKYICAIALCCQLCISEYSKQIVREAPLQSIQSSSVA